jgi:hypothetical protein
LWKIVRNEVVRKTEEKGVHLEVVEVEEEEVEVDGEGLEVNED